MTDLSRSYRLASRMAAIEPSPFLAVLRAAREVERQGREVLYLSMGEPDFETPEHVREAGVSAIRRGETRYTAMDGTPALKAAIAEKTERDNRLTYVADEITVTLGGTQGIFNGMFATVGPGDEVVLPAPYFQPYLSAIRLAGATPVIVQTREEDDFNLSPEALTAAITTKTRWVILNSPSNPSGAVVGPETLAALADVLRRHPDVLVWSDDIYESIQFHGRFENIVNVAPDLRDRTVILNGVSKAYAMTGWRVGWLCGPAPLIEAISQVSATQTFTPCSITQAGAVEALTGDQASVAAQCAVYAARAARMTDGLGAIPGLTLAPPRGAFYAFPGCHALMGTTTPGGETVRSDLDLALHVLRHSGVASVGGSAFGTPGHLRLSFAASEDVLDRALDGIASACAALDGRTEG